MTTRTGWLNLTQEPPIDPEVPICDPHHHLWDYPEAMPASATPPRIMQPRHYLLDQLLQDIGGGHKITQTVFLQCFQMYRKKGPMEMAPVGETEFVQGIAAQSYSGRYGDTEVAAGIVSYADLTLGSAAAPVLEAHLQASPNRMRGIRFITTYDTNQGVQSTAKSPDILSNPGFREGFAYLQRYNLSFDAWLYHTQLPGLADLAKAFPQVPIILNHLGGPLGIGPYAAGKAEVMKQWQNGITELALYPNVVMKLGGVGMPMFGFDWHQRLKPIGSPELAQSLAPYFTWCIEKFGVQRCMLESNFPVDRVSYSYTVLWNAFKLFARAYSASEKAALFHDTAVRVYRLK